MTQNKVESVLQKSDVDELMRNPKVFFGLLEEAYEASEEVATQIRINPHECIDKPRRSYHGDAPTVSAPIPAGQVRADEENVARLEKIWKTRDLSGDPFDFKTYYRRERWQRTAAAFETIAASTATELFGSNVEIKLLSRIDDIRGLDAVVIFNDEKGNVDAILGLDFTLTTEERAVRKKIRDSLIELIHKNLSKITYGQRTNAQKETEYFSADGIPRVVFGMSWHSSLLHAMRWLKGEKGKDIFSPEQKMAMLRSVSDQLRGQLFISRDRDTREDEGKESFATERLQRVYDLIQQVIDESGINPDNTDDDRGVERIRGIARSRTTMKELYEQAKKKGK